VDAQPAHATADELAGLGRRIGGLCYEALLLAAILFASAWIFPAVSPYLHPALARPLFQFYLVVVSGVYFIYCWTHGGQTLPMKTWRVRVVTRDGGALTLARGLRRFLYALAGLALGGFGFVWAIVDRDRLFLHDRLAGTRIVRCC
jgi:uncharacterized RDD family membrane protein YckC